MQSAIQGLFGSVARTVFSDRARARARRDDDDADRAFDDDDVLSDDDAPRAATTAGKRRRGSTTPVASAAGRDAGERGERMGGTATTGTASASASGGETVAATIGRTTAKRRGMVLKEVENIMNGAKGAAGESLGEDGGETATAAEDGERARKKGSSGPPVKNIDFDVDDAAGDGTPRMDRVKRTSPPSTSGRKREFRVTPGKSGGASAAFSPNIGGSMASPTIFGRVDDVVAGLGSDCESESEAETEEFDEDDGGTQCYEDDYAGGTQVLDSAALCDAPTGLDLVLAARKEEVEPPCERGGDAAIRLLRRRLFGVNRERPIDADGLEFAPNLKAHRDHLLNILEDTVSGGQNNSVLMVGNRGSGKSLVLDSALKILESKHPGKVVTVHLSGLLHADERIAMQKIASQLCPNMNEDVTGRQTGFAENVAFMTEMLKLLGGQRGVIFVLDDFELFAMRSKQTLLYAITDLLQQSTVQAAVVGVTCRHSVDRLLEKRVASRFSNRRIVVAPPGNTVSMVEGVTKALKLSDKDKYLCPSDPDYVQQWNLHLRAAMQSPVVKEKLEHYGRLENTPASVSKVACAILSRVNRQLGKITSNDIVEAVDSLYRNPFVDSLIGATTLELLLCVAMYRMHVARKRPSFTFEALAQEFREMGSREQLTHAKDSSRSVLVRAFENLLTLGIATAHKSGSGVRGAALKEYKNIVFVVEPEELREAIRRHPNPIPGLADFMDHESLRIAHTV